MKKFDIFESYMKLLLEQGEQEITMPPQQSQTNDQQQQVPTQQPNTSEREPFRDLIGGTISNISFKKVGSNGGQITITTSNSHVPTVISWVGTKTSVRLSNGNVVLLSE